MATNVDKSAVQVRSLPQHKLLAWIEHRSTMLLIIIILLFVMALFIGLTAKLFFWAQGYDQIDYQQSIWNTTQGRFLEISHYRHTDSLWGMDFIPAILLIVPFYALFPSALTLNFFQALCVALGALPSYAVARDYFGRRSAGLAWAAIYLLYPATWFVTMTAPWQPRVLALPALIGAFYFLQKAVRMPKQQRPALRLWVGFMFCLLLALTTRTDASLCVIAFGLLAALWRMRWQWIIVPMVIGLAWLWVSTSVIVPRFYRSDYVPQTLSGDACADYSKTWPGKSPQLAYYCHLGGSVQEILLTILTQPQKVAQIVFTAPKMSYLLIMLLPLCLLPLLAPDAALPALPILALNVLTNRPFQYSVRDQYQTLVIPGLIIASIVGAARLWQWWQKQGQRRWQGSYALALALCVVSITNLAYRNPVITTFLYKEDAARLEAMHSLAALVPADASLAVSSFLAPNMMPRRHIFYFPNSPSFPSLDQAEYVFVDLRAAALDNELGRSALAELQNPERWQQIAASHDLVLFQRRNK